MKGGRNSLPFCCCICFKPSSKLLRLWDGHVS